MKTETRLRFTCPMCGCHYFGSVGGVTIPLVRHCHGQRGDEACDFSFPSSRDWQYFRLEQISAAENAAEYLKLERCRWRQRPSGRVIRGKR